MTIESLQSFFGWSTTMNVLLLICWLLFFRLGHGLMFQLHGRLFKVSEETFDLIHYAGMAFYKIAILLLNLVPYLVLRFCINVPDAPGAGIQLISPN